jgi:hypothetical protein
MKFKAYQANAVIVNANTDPKRHGVCGNDGIITFQPPELRDKFLAEHLSLSKSKDDLCVDINLALAAVFANVGTPDAERRIIRDAVAAVINNHGA